MARITPPKGFVAIEGSTRILPPGARRLRAADPDERVDITVCLRRRSDGPPVPDHAEFLRIPPRARPKLNPDEFAARYGASQDDIDAVVTFATSHHLAVTTVNAAARTLTVRGTVRQLNAAFGVELGAYEHTFDFRPGRKVAPVKATFRGREGAIHVPAALADVIVGVFGLDNRPVGGRNGAEPPNTGTVTTSQVAALYDYPSNSAAGQTIGILALDYSGYGPQYDSGYAAADISASTGAGATVTDILVNGATNPGDDQLGETTQDIEIALGFAPGAGVNVYITTPDQQGWVQALTRFAHPQAGDPVASVLSSSYFISDGDDAAGLAAQGVTGAFVNAVSAAFQDAALQGVTVVIASGDRGTDSNMADGKAHVQYPASDPWVLCVGGTTIGNINGSSFDEYVWNDPYPADDSFNPNWGTTGGGVSARFAIPTYQAGVAVPASLDDATHHGRGVPDVAGNANDHSGYSDVVIGGSGAVGNGTSASAPQWAGLIAVLNAALGVNVGFVNPALYALGGVGFRDIVPGSGPGDNANAGVGGYPAGPGWDACTGLGSPRGKALLGALRAVYTRALTFLVDKSTFSRDEVTDAPAGLFLNAFWLVLDGYSINQLGGLLPTLGGAFPGLAGVTIIPDANPDYERPGDLYTPQRIRFAYHLQFGSLDSFPAAGDPAVEYALTASLTLAGTTLDAAVLMELAGGADPYFTNLDPTHDDQRPWLSQDLRVFSIESGSSAVPGAPAMSANPYSSIQALLQYLNTTAAYTTPGADLLNGLPGQSGYETGDSTVSPVNGSGDKLNNYAIARVRVRGAPNSTITGVRVFFRLFVAPSCDTDFDPNGTYKRQEGTGAEAGLPVKPLPSGDGLVDPSGNAVKTIPYFATDASGTHDYDGTVADANIRDVTLPASGERWVYFGCHLDVYDADAQSKFPGTHHCIVAEIAYDQTPLRNQDGVTLTPFTSDKLAQRNLQITSSGNPSFPATHRIPQAFDTRGSTPGAPLGLPDELMIDWRDIPVGSAARIFWPGVSAQAVVDLADTLYAAHGLHVIDGNTLGCVTTKGVTYVPIPFASGKNLAGLFTLELPEGIHVGQEFSAYVRRVTSRRVAGVKQGVYTYAAKTEGHKSAGRSLAWRYVTGAFEVRVPVVADAAQVGPEETTLAILRWRLEHMDPAYRWYPVLQRLVGDVAVRVDGFGGDADSVVPSLTGGVRPGEGSPGGCGCDPGQTRPTKTGVAIGRVAEVVFDCRGDFEGFVLCGCDRSWVFRSCEPAVRDLVLRALHERLTLEVRAGRGGRIVGLIVRGCC